MFMSALRENQNNSHCNTWYGLELLTSKQQADMTTNDGSSISSQDNISEINGSMSSATLSSSNSINTVTQRTSSTRTRMKWDRNMNVAVVRSHFKALIENPDTYSKSLHKNFKETYPDLDVTAQESLTKDAPSLIGPVRILRVQEGLKNSTALGFHKQSWMLLKQKLTSCIQDEMVIISLHLMEILMRLYDLIQSSIPKTTWRTKIRRKVKKQRP